MDRSMYEFGQEMAQLMPKFMREVFKNYTMTHSGGDVTIPQMSILNVLRHGGQLKMKEIAGYLSVTTSAATGLVERMVKLNLLKRVAGQKDRRVIRIHMTERGRRIIDEIEKQRYKMIMGLFSKLTPLERKRYLETIKKLYRIMTEGKK
ncbi:MAG: MarR family transcriptional regulator [Candidatus Omnitrophica bacterium]|nr:MarR family transcriptional regulator [Candidatus Omnitrophota bacterium]